MQSRPVAPLEDMPDMTDFDIAAYLSRLGLDGASAGIDGLSRLQEAQIRAIPFENVDALLGRPPATDLPSVADKILRGGRGGWCFELNALLEAALASLAHQIERRLARVRMGRREGGPRTHIAMVCTVRDERWLVDAGFGGPAPLTPLRLDRDDLQKAPNGTYCIRTDAVTGERVVSAITPEGEFSLYGIDEAHVTDPDIVAASFVCSAWSGSPFPTHLMVNGYDGATRIGVFDTVATLDDGKRREKVELTSSHALGNVLAGRLALPLEGSEVDAIWSRIAGPASWRGNSPSA